MSAYCILYVVLGCAVKLNVLPETVILGLSFPDELILGDLFDHAGAVNCI